MNVRQRIIGLQRNDPRILWSISLLLALGIFLIDAFTPLDIAIAVLYVAVVLVVGLTGNRLATILVSAACALLTAFAFLMSHNADYTGAAAARCAVSLLAIATTALLAIRNQTTAARLLEQVELLDMTHDAIVVYDMNDRITFWNHGAEDLYGWRPNEAVGRSIHELTGSRSTIPIDTIRENLLASGHWDGEIERRRKNGNRVLVSSRLRLWRDRNGRARAVLATSNDVTEQRRMQLDLQRSEALLSEAQRLSKTGSIAIDIADGTQRAMVWSNEAYRIYGYPPDAIPSLALIEARTPAEDLGIVRDVHAQFLAGQPSIDAEHRLCMPDGEIKYVHFVARALPSAGGHGEYVGALMDVSDARRTQEALERSMSELAHVARITTLGELASSIAHEVAQPVAAIVTCGEAGLRWLNRPEPDLPEVRQSIEQMIRDARRASDVVRQIRSMAKKRAPVRASVALSELVEQSTGLIRRELQHHDVILTTDLAPGLVLQNADRVQIQQVLINLMMNGIQAMAGRQDSPRTLEVSTRGIDDDQAAITVRDSGPGIQDVDMEKLFSAFYTTKDDGMGMGLSICRSIVENHGGRIWADSSPAHGASFTFMLPARS
jgi:PAS domain S-box-containing protein